jgi:kynureninase
MANRFISENLEALLSKEFSENEIKQDSLSFLRSEFLFPSINENGNKKQSIYLCGNSLGLQPRRTRDYVGEELDKWAIHGVEGHFTNPRPWVTTDEDVRNCLEKVVGAKEGAGEVVAMNGLTVNLHLLMAGFYRPNKISKEKETTNLIEKTTRRHKILIEQHAFPSDAHAVQSQILLQGGKLEESLIEIAPRKGEEILHIEDIEAAIKLHGDELSLILLPGIQYYSGQLLPIERLTRAAHAVGARAGWDLAHAVGNVHLQLHEWNVDFACWCSYKYLNSGPGGLAGAFLHERFADVSFQELPHFAGWWGHRKSDRFKMETNFIPSRGISGWQLSNPPVLAVAALRASLDVFEIAMCGQGELVSSSLTSTSTPSSSSSWDVLEFKSRSLTGYLEAILIKSLVSSGDLKIVTPSNPSERGCQLSVKFITLPVKSVHNALSTRNFIVDVREPELMRIAPAPLYNNAEDVRQFACALIDIVKELKQNK